MIAAVPRAAADAGAVESSAHFRRGRCDAAGLPPRVCERRVRIQLNTPSCFCCIRMQPSQQAGGRQAAAHLATRRALRPARSGTITAVCNTVWQHVWVTLSFAVAAPKARHFRGDFAGVSDTAPRKVRPRAAAAGYAAPTPAATCRFYQMTGYNREEVLGHNWCATATHKPGTCLCTRPRNRRWISEVRQKVFTSSPWAMSSWPLALRNCGTRHGAQHWRRRLRKPAPTAATASAPCLQRAHKPAHAVTTCQAPHT